MELTLTGETSIKELNKAFNSYFPFLRLQFNSLTQGMGDPPNLSLKEKGQVKLSEISNHFSMGVLVFKPVTSIKEFVQKIHKVHGLQVRLLRRSGDTWIEANESEEMTLQFENALGAASIRKIDFNVNMLFL